MNSPFHRVQLLHGAVTGKKLFRRVADIRGLFVALSWLGRTWLGCYVLGGSRHFPGR